MLWEVGKLWENMVWEVGKLRGNMLWEVGKLWGNILWEAGKLWENIFKNELLQHINQIRQNTTQPPNDFVKPIIPDKPIIPVRPFIHVKPIIQRDFKRLFYNIKN